MIHCNLGHEAIQLCFTGAVPKAGNQKPCGNTRREVVHLPSKHTNQECIRDQKLTLKSHNKLSIFRHPSISHPIKHHTLCHI